VNKNIIFAAIQNVLPNLWIHYEEIYIGKQIKKPSKNPVCGFFDGLKNAYIFIAALNPSWIASPRERGAFASPMMYTSVSGRR
jgi:hypothetical protein